MRARWLWLGLWIAVGGALGAPAAAEEWKNLQVLPKDLGRPQLKELMRAQARALNVECEHCHDLPDFASDARETKRVAREMMRMTAELNQRWLKPLKDADKHPVTCATCHRGKPIPDR